MSEADEVKTRIAVIQSDIAVARYSVMEARQRLSDVKAGIDRVDTTDIEFSMGKQLAYQIDRDLESALADFAVMNQHLESYRVML